MNREDFPMLKSDIIYFDNAATSFKPNCVINAMNEYYQNYSSNVHRGDYEISYQADKMYDEARNTVSRFINARKEEVVFTSGTTESLNMIVNGFFDGVLDSGDEVLITLSEHASNVLPWFKLALKKNIIVKYIDLDSTLHLTLDNLKKAITPKTKVISIASVTNVVGDSRPVKEICQFAHQNNIFVVLDGAQSVAHEVTDVADIDCDFLAFSGHKMCGPTGVGVLYAKKELLESMEPVNFGGGMNESFDSVNEIYLKEIPTRLEAGTPNIAGVIGLKEAINYLNELGMDEINLREIKLKKYLVDKLKNIPHINIINEECESGIVAFNVDGIFAQDVAIYLSKYNICVRAGSHCAKQLKDATGIKNTVRISLYFYNTTEEIDKLVDLLTNKEKIISEMI